MQVPAYVNGCIAPTFTAFGDDGSFDEAGQRNLLDYLESVGGISAYFVRSGMGQMYSFSYDEVKAIARVACGHLAGRTPVLVGCSGVWDRNYDARPDRAAYLKQGIELGQYAAEQGADGAVYTMPEALVPEDGETYDDLFEAYFEKICAAVPLPVFIYQPPGARPEYLLSPARVQTLGAIENLVGAKASMADGYFMFNLIRASKGMDFEVIMGHEGIFYFGLTAGAKAVIGQGTTLNPHVMNAVKERHAAGDLEGAMAAQDAVNHLCETCPNPQDFLKLYATEKGYPVPRHFRTVGDNPYMKDPKPLTPKAYETFKRDFEETVAPFV